MAQTIKLRRSATAGAVPTTSSLSLGEVAINTYDGKMYIKKDDGSESVVEVGDTSGGLPLTGGTLTGAITIPDYVIHSGNTNTKFGFPSANIINFTTNGTERLALAGSYTVFNESGADVDFRVEAVNSTHALFVQGSDGKVGIGTTAPQGHLDINTESAEATTVIINGEINQDKILKFRHHSNSEGAGNGYAGFIGSVVDNVLTLGHYNSSNAEVQSLHVTEAGNVGIGTDSPQQLLELSSGTSPHLRITNTTNSNDHDNGDVFGGVEFFTADTGYDGPIVNGYVRSMHLRTGGGTGHSSADGGLQFGVSEGTQDIEAVAAMSIVTGGNVGIGTTAPDTLLHVNGQAKFENNITLNENTPALVIPNGDFRIFTGGAEKVRIDSSGNLLVGKTTNSVDIVGGIIRANGLVNGCSDSNYSAIFSRNTNDGDIVLFRKDGTTVGSISTVDGDLNVFASAAGHKGLRFGNGYIAPTSNNTTVENNTVDLGLSTHQFKDLHLAGTANVGGLTVNSAFTFPTADGSTNQVLKTDGSGNMSWVSVAVGTPTYLADADNNTKIQVEESADENKIRFDTAGSERMIIDATGNVGIGTTAPEAKLQISHNGGHTSGTVQIAESSFDLYNPLEANTDEKGSVVTFSDNYYDGTNYIRTTRAGIKGGTDTVGNNASGFLTFFTNSGGANTLNERMRITKDGRVGIGTTSPATDLHIKNASSTQLLLESSNTDTGFLLFGDAQDLNIGSVSYSHSENSMRFETDDAERMRIDDSGNVGIGTSSPAKKLSVKADGGGSQLGIDIHNEGLAAGDDAVISFEAQASREWTMGLDRSSSSFVIAESSTLDSNQRLVIDDSGNVGIGCTPSAHAFSKAIQIGDGAVWTVSGNQNTTFASNAYLAINGSFKYIAANKASKINLYNGGFTVATTNTSGSADGDITFTDRLTVNSQGNVGIGTSSPALAGGGTGLHINATSYPEIKFTNSTTGSAAGDGSLIQGNGNNLTIQNREAGSITFSTSNTERMRIDASGNLLVGKTADNNAVAGTTISNIGAVKVTRTDWSLLLNRLTTDGELALFQKDSATVGSIGVSGGNNVYISGSQTNHSGLIFATNEILPTNAGGAGTNGLESLGSSSNRFKDLHLSAGAYASFIAGQNDTNTSINFPGSDVTVFYTGGAERMRISSSGDVSIGTTAGSGRRLDVLTANDYVARFASSDSYAGIIIEDSESTANYNRLAVQGNNMLFDVNNSTRMKITSAGNVGIGTTSPAEKLHISGGNILLNNALEIRTKDTGGNIRTIVRANSSNELEYGWSANGAVKFMGGGSYTERMRIHTNGNVGIGTTAPQAKLHVNEGPVYIGDYTGTVTPTEGIFLENAAGNSNTITMYTYGASVFKIESDGLEANIGWGSSADREVNFVNTGAGRIKVGIGTSSPASNLHIKTSVDNSVAQGLVIERSANSDKGYINYNGGGFQFRSTVGDPIVFGETDAEHMRILPDGNVGIGTTSPAAQLQIKQLGINVNQSSVASTNQYTCDSMSATIFRSARYTIQITNTTDSTYHITEMLLIHDGTTPSINEFGTIFTGSAAEAVFTADITSGNVRLLATPASSDAMQFKVVRHSILV